MVGLVRAADRAAPAIRSAAAAPLLALWPGLALTAAIAAAAFGLRQLPYLGGLSPMILAILIGMVAHNVLGTPARARPGVAFAMRRVLRAAIVLLGLQLTAAQVAEVGGTGVAVIALTLVATFVFTTWLGRLIGVERGLAELIAAGTSICGASAVIATNTVTRAPDEDVAYAVACVTVFGSIAMLGYPLLVGVLDLSPHAYGLWAGASIHEIAQVVAAAYQDGAAAGEFGTIAKLSRVMLLAPVVIALGLMATRRARRQRDEVAGGEAGGARPPMPWFVLGFLGMVALNSLVTLPAELKSHLVVATSFLLSMALAAMGLETSLAKLRAKGIRPFALGFAAFAFIAGFSLMLVKITA
ncbi:YeiH family putative sulfate export transporter [Ancylobacter sonchi]|nr:YeiH family putative sulfate export transporter [Ancylobacter sonchi]